MKHKKYLRKQVDGDDSENVSGDDKEDDESSALSMKFIKKEGDERDDLVNPTGQKREEASFIHIHCYVFQMIKVTRIMRRRHKSLYSNKGRIG